MGDFNKIRPLSKKIAVDLIKGEKPKDLLDSEIFDMKTREQILSDIKEGKYSELLSQIDIENGWKGLEQNIKRPKTSSKFWYYGLAASVVLLISIGLVFNKTNRDQNQNFDVPVIVNNNIGIGTNKATLTLEDGTDVVLEKGQIYESNNVASNGEEIVYATNNKTDSQIAYNTLTIPRGGQFYILLSDGTKVWLNSESQLKYPVTFNEGEMRQVELVYGEAYFDVSPSIENKGAKFRVLHNAQEVEVLGTEFNIKAYKDETNIYTTLVEGKVAVNTVGVDQVLIPNQQLNLNLKTNSINITTIDVYNEIAWKDGVFSFENKPLKEILKVLSRWYDMDVVIKNAVQTEERFIGTFNKSNNIEDILIAIKSTNFINNYEIKDKTLTIK